MASPDRLKRPSGDVGSPSWRARNQALAVRDALDAQLAGRGRWDARLGLILGSGQGNFTERIRQPVAVPFEDIPGFPRATVHTGRLLTGYLGEIPLYCFQGRVHAYEGYSPTTVAMPVRLLWSLGIDTLLVTNAAGGIREDLQPGDFLLLNDHLNGLGFNPLTGLNDDCLGPRFPDLTEAYHPELRAAAHQAAREVGMNLTEGVYAALLGPSFETPAEIRALARLGADCVGMSTVPEVIAANHAGIRVAALSCISNRAAGTGNGIITHQEVGEVIARVAPLLGDFLERWCSLAVE